jgi:Tfp pilus assembly protein PilF
MNTARIEQLQKLLQEEPTDAFLQHALAMEYASANEHQKAVEVLTNLLATQPNYLASYYQLGQLFEKLNNTSAAQDTYRKGIEIAKQQAKIKTLAELREALSQLEDD